MDRRAFLGASGALIAGLAGCVGGSRSGGGMALDALDVAGSPGGRVTLEPPGHPVLLDFFATWCAPCKPQMKHLREIHRTSPEVHLVSITSEKDRDAIAAFWREYRGTWPVVIDPELRATENYGVRNIPTLILIAPDGTETWRHVGLASADSIAEKIDATA